VEDVIEVSRNGDELGDVIFDEGETFVPYEVEDILHVPGEEVIHADNLMSLPDTVFAEVRIQETPSTCNQRPLHKKCLPDMLFFRSIAPGLCKGDLFLQLRGLHPEYFIRH